MRRVAVKNYVISLILMGVVSLLWLLGLSLFTYVCKWQAEQTMIGIMSAYVLSGFLGGMTEGKLQKADTARIKRGFLLGTGYMLCLLLLSLWVLKEVRWDLLRLVMIWIMLVSSSILGEFFSGKSQKT